MRIWVMWGLLFSGCIIDREAIDEEDGEAAEEGPPREGPEAGPVGDTGGRGGGGGGEAPSGDAAVAELRCPEEGDPCPGVCGWYADCADQLCVGYGRGDRPELIDGCMETCEQSGAFPAIICQHTRCAQTVNLARGSDPDFAARCDGEGGGGGSERCPSEVDECLSACGWVADCAVDACPGYGPEDGPGLRERCQGFCASNPALAAIVCTHSTCEQTIELMRGAQPNFQDGCDGGGLDTQPAGPVNAWGPSARVVYLEMPPSPIDATQAGCGLVGIGQGSNFGAFAALIEGGLPATVQPDANGEISYVLLGQLDGWPEGLTGNQVGEVTLNLFEGDFSAGGFNLSRETFVDGDPARGPRNFFPRTAVVQELLSTPRGELSLQLPFLPGVPAAFALSGVQLRGGLGMDRTGFVLRNGILSGYFTRAAYLDWLGDILDYCRAQPELDTCLTLLPLLGGPNVDVETAYSIMTALTPPDARYRDGVAEECGPGECDAIGVCLMVEMAPVLIDGVGP